MMKKRITMAWWVIMELRRYSKIKHDEVMQNLENMTSTTKKSVRVAMERHTLRHTRITIIKRENKKSALVKI